MSDDATPEAKLNIATYFIMNTPTGEVQDVVTDVTKLLNDSSVLNDAALAGILRNYNLDQLLAVSDSENNQLLITPHNEVDRSHYYDPNKGRVVKFDHRKQKVLEITDKKYTVDPEHHKVRAATQKHMDTYVDSNYKQGKVVCGVFATDKAKLHVCVSARNVNLGNFWTGGWRSTFSVSIGSSGQADLKGSIKVNVHYYEDGNVQLHTTLEKSAHVEVKSDADATALGITKAIVQIESDFQSQLEEMYVNMHHKTFKSMRRFYPVTRTPMNWNTSAHSLATEVTKSDNSKTS